MEYITNYQTILIPESLKDRYIKRAEQALKNGFILSINKTNYGFYIKHQRPSGIYEIVEYIFK